MGQLDSSNTSKSKSITPIIPAVQSLVGEVFFSRNSNLLDVIRFYQVTKMVSDTLIIVRELHQMNHYKDNIGYCSPISGRFISKEIEVELNNQHIFKSGDFYGTYLNHTVLTISKGVSVKVWDHITHFTQ